MWLLRFRSIIVSKISVPSAFSASVLRCAKQQVPDAVRPVTRSVHDIERLHPQHQLFTRLAHHLRLDPGWDASALRPVNGEVRRLKEIAISVAQNVSAELLASIRKPLGIDIDRK